MQWMIETYLRKLKILAGSDDRVVADPFLIYLDLEETDQDFDEQTRSNILPLK
jgi:hypothetical protein